MQAAAGAIGAVSCTKGHITQEQTPLYSIKLANLVKPVKVSTFETLITTLWHVFQVKQ